jgi:hypothetical protein
VIMLPQSLLSASDVIALCRRRVIESRRRSPTQTVVNQGLKTGYADPYCGIELKPEPSRGGRRAIPRSKALYSIDLA